MMQSAVHARLSTQVLVVGGLATLWTGFAAFDFLMTLSGDPAYLAGFSDAQRAYVASYPREMIAFGTLNVFSGVAGSLLLLVRSRLAGSMYLLSLVGLMATTLYQFGLTNPPEDMTSPPMLAMMAAIWTGAIGLLIYAQVMAKRGALR